MTTRAGDLRPVRVEIMDVNVETKVALGRAFGRVYNIDMSILPQGVVYLPLPGQIWWVSRQHGRLTLLAEDSDKLVDATPGALLPGIEDVLPYRRGFNANLPDPEDNEGVAWWNYDLDALQVSNGSEWQTVFTATETIEPDTEWHIIGDTGEPAFQDTWEQYGSSYQEAGFFLDSEGWVHFRGLIKNGTASSVIFTLPEEYRPDVATYCIGQAGGGHFGYVKVFTNGDVACTWYSPASNGYFTLSGMQFPLPTSPSFVRRQRVHGIPGRAGYEEQKPAVRLRDNGMAVLNGIGAATTAVSGLFPPVGDFEPMALTMITAGNPANDVRSFQVGGAYGSQLLHTTTSWTMLDGEYPTWLTNHLWEEPTLENSWVYYGITSEAFNTPGYFKDQFGFVHLKGLVKSGSVSASIFTLPEGYRAGKDEIFTTQAYGATNASRVDVKTDGEVYAGVGTSTTWTSLDGINFYAEA